MLQKTIFFREHDFLVVKQLLPIVKSDFFLAHGGGIYYFTSVATR